MQFHLNRKTFNALVLLVCAYVVFSNFYFQVGQTLSYDVYGYYLYLPLTFIYGDLRLQHPELIFELMDKYHSPGVFYQGHQTETGYWVMKYTMGQSILYAPFFFIGHWIANFSSYPADGFSKPYELSVFVGGILYTLIGVFFFVKILLHFFNEKVALMVLLITVFGTNYLLHNTMFSQNPMTHNTLFMLYAIIVWLTISWNKKPSVKILWYLGLAMGLAILIRPTELVCLFIPGLWLLLDKKQKSENIQWFKYHKKQVLLFLLLVLGIPALQLIYFKIYTGNFFYLDFNGNNGEGLDLFAPYTLEVLFSFRKGWLIYTPIMLFSIMGFFSLYKRNRNLFWPLFIYFLVNLWLVSSWTCWWYAGSFSQRALIPSYVVLGITMGYFLTAILEKKVVSRILVFTVLACFIVLNLFQTYQYKQGILHPDRMTKPYYLKIFGQTEKDNDAQELLLFDRDEAYSSKTIDSSDYRKTMQLTEDFENLAYHFSSSAHSGNKSEHLSKDHPYSVSLARPYDALTQKDRIWIKVSAWVYTKKVRANQQFYLVAHTDHKGKAYQYETLDSKALQLPVNQWTKISFNYLTPPIRRRFNEVKASVWLKDGADIWVDDLQMEIWEPIH